MKLPAREKKQQNNQGTKGQIVCTLHDPDEIYVLAESFEDYLQMLIDQQCAFVDEEE